MLRELTRNLLHNAIKHSPDGAALVVRVDALDGHAVLTVSDRGPGIDGELRQRLFQPFSAGNARTGSGLGLAICREIVAALGGDIELNNRDQPTFAAGLDAVVRLPLANS
jgi:two-component system sensor histidine kinase TctE